MPEIFAVGPAAACAAAEKRGLSPCLLGWSAEADGLFRAPDARACRLAGVRVRAVPAGLGAGLARECARSGADGVLLDAETASDALVREASLLLSLGLRVFSPVPLPGGIAVSAGPEGPAVLLEPRRKSTALSPGAPPRDRTLSDDELRRLGRLSGVPCPAELGSRYLVRRRGGGRTEIFVFDTPETFRRRLAACRAETVFLCWERVSVFF